MLQVKILKTDYKSESMSPRDAWAIMKANKWGAIYVYVNFTTAIESAHRKHRLNYFSILMLTWQTTKI